MSSFYAPTHHPETGKVKKARWADDYFGRHQYGVQFDEEEKFWPENKCRQADPNALFDQNAAMREALEYIERHGKCGCNIKARAALALADGETER